MFSSNLPVGLGVEAEPVEPALHVAALAFIEANLVLGDLVTLFGVGRRIDARRQVASTFEGPSCKEAMRASASDLNCPLG